MIDQNIKKILLERGVTEQFIKKTWLNIVEEAGEHIAKEAFFLIAKKPEVKIYLSDEAWGHGDFHYVISHSGVINDDNFWLNAFKELEQALNFCFEFKLNYEMDSNLNFCWICKICHKVINKKELVNGEAVYYEKVGVVHTKHKGVKKRLKIE